MKRNYISQLHESIGKEVSISGWLSVRRDHGSLIFLDVRDHSGSVQVVVIPKVEAAYQIAEQLRPEWVITIEGVVNKRPEQAINKDQVNGDIELFTNSLVVLNSSETPPIEITDSGYDTKEEKRLQYRYLDLRRSRLQKNIKLRSALTNLIRQFLLERGFLEIETPILTKSTPEGARDFVVPSRVSPGNFYALPQSPQQYKQLLMVAGFERYFQIARCFRDEDTRGDRQPEFTQLDLEMSFVEKTDVMSINEELLIKIVKEISPNKKISQVPFPRLTYKQSMDKYGTDRPDLRANKEDPDELAFVWITDFPFFEKDKSGKWTFTHNPFSSPIDEHLQWLMEGKNIGEILTTQYDAVLNGFEIGGGSLRAHKPEQLRKVFEIMGFDDTRINENFGHMLEALTFGAPPHGGIAWGLDRVAAVLTNEPNIREVIAFPKTGEGRDPMMGSPAPITEEQLRELHLKIKD